MKNNKKAAFTLAEVLITLGILGVLILFLIPVLQNSMPGRDKAFVRKCYFTTKNTLYLILNNPSMYPTEDRLMSENTTKFIENFSSYLKTSYSSDDNHFAKTNDGVDWYYEGAWANKTGYGVTIYFDVDGNENGPNCTQYTSAPDSYTSCGGNDLPDTYAIGIRYDGKLFIYPTIQTYMADILSDSTNIKHE